MVDVEKLSNAELQSKLQEYGFPVVPITASTRKVLLKKIKLILENKDKITPDQRRSMGQYSSDDSESDASTVRNRNRRATMGAPTMQPPKALKKTTRIVETTIEEDVPKKRETRASTSFSTSSRTNRIIRSAQDEFDTGSDSESEINSRQSSSYQNDKTGSPLKSMDSSLHTTYNTSFGSRASSRPTLDNTYNRNFPSSPGSPAAFSSPVNSADVISDRLNQIRSRLSLNNSGFDRPSYSVASENIEKPETPFLSNFTRRLSQLSASKPHNDYDSQHDIIKEHDTNGANNYPRTQYSSYRSTIRPREYQYDYSKSLQNNLFKNNIVPFTVLGVAFLFFIFVGFVYLGMRSDTAIEPSGVKIPRCDKFDPTHKRGINCVMEEDVTDAVNLLKVLKTELHERAVKKLCWNARSHQSMKEPDVIEFVKDHFKIKDETKIMNDLRNLEVLILKNPSWRIAIAQVQDATDEITDAHIVKNLDNLGFERVLKPISLVVLDPNIPWTCSLYNKLFYLFKTLFFLTTIFALVFGSRTAYKYYNQYQKNRRNEVILLVERIIDILQNGACQDERQLQSYVVINHVRDMIIPVNERKNKENIWKEAVTFINENESRVRIETQVVQGEEYDVWRWVGSRDLSMAGPSKNKSWQGQAFETQTGAVNSLPCSPTPCLKIRGMIEDGDRNTQLIKEAVLSKCAQKCRILHCAVDTNMKCVYLKCVDTGDAAVAYQNLHGWWYSGQLVTVKYLRLERYMQRFPDSPHGGPPFLKATSPATDWAS